MTVDLIYSSVFRGKLIMAFKKVYDTKKRKYVKKLQSMKMKKFLISYGKLLIRQSVFLT